MLTKEQNVVVNIKESGVYSVRAVAGSGKTFTAIEYMKKHSDERILYLVFNASNRRELKEKLSDRGIRNVDVHTVHSYCYSKTISNKNSKIHNEFARKIKVGFGIDTSDLMDLYGFNYVTAKSILDLYDKYLQSDVSLNEFLLGVRKKEIFAKIFSWIDSSFKNGDYYIPHDYYVKWYSDNSGKDFYDTIIVDEAQDINKVMFKVILNIDCDKLILIGDSEQLIYGWRGAIDSLKKVKDYRENVNFLELTNSFRVGKEIAHIAEVFTGKKVSGLGNNEFVEEEEIMKNEKYTVMGFSNGSLFSWYVKHLQVLEGVKIFFRNFDPREIWNMINFARGEYSKVYDKGLLKFGTFKELLRVLDFDEILDISDVKKNDEKYGNLEEKYRDLAKLIKIYGYSFLIMVLSKIKENSVEFGEERVLLTTVHTSKGAEFDNLIMLWGGLIDFSFLDGVVDDMCNDDEMILDGKRFKNAKGYIKYFRENFGTKFNNENFLGLLNVFYVAITRAKGKLYVENSLLMEYLKSLVK